MGVADRRPVRARLHHRQEELMNRREALARHLADNDYPDHHAYAWADQIINLMEGEHE